MSMNRRQFLWTGAAGALSACTSTPGDSGEAPLGPDTAVSLNLQPWVALTGPTSAVLTFETLEDAELPVTLAADDEPYDVLLPERQVDEVDFAWPSGDLPDGVDVLPDLPGTHVLHTVERTDLVPGTKYRWTVHRGGGEQSTGTFTTPPSEAAAVRLGWIADTMHPYSTESFAQLEAAQADLVLHGGDIQYQSNPTDTWAGMSVKLAPIAATAPVWFTVGNHEFEDQNEIEVMYERLLGGQGMPRTDGRWFKIQWGPVRLLVLDSEDGSTGDASSAQIAWLDAELADGKASGDVLIVAFHRPIYTLSKHASESTTTRDVLHPRFVDAGVKLVLMGHVHAFERFDVDGVVYWVDGGGGSLLYSIDEEAEAVEQWRPGEGALRVAAERSYGITTVDIAPTGQLTVRRMRAEDGTMGHELVIPA